MLTSNCQSGPLRHSVLPKEYWENMKSYTTFIFLLVSLPLATSNILLQLYPNLYLCSTSFVTLVLTLIEQNFLPLILLTVELRALFPPLRKFPVMFPPRLLQQRSQFSTEVRLKTLGSHCVRPITQRVCRLYGLRCCFHQEHSFYLHAGWPPFYLYHSFALFGLQACWNMDRSFCLLRLPSHDYYHNHDSHH